MLCWFIKAFTWNSMKYHYFNKVNFNKRELTLSMMEDLNIVIVYFSVSITINGFSSSLLSCSGKFPFFPCRTGHFAEISSSSVATSDCTKRKHVLFCSRSIKIASEIFHGFVSILFVQKNKTECFRKKHRHHSWICLERHVHHRTRVVPMVPSSFSKQDEK